jgi:Sortase domain
VSRPHLLAAGISAVALIAAPAWGVISRPEKDVGSLAAIEREGSPPTRAPRVLGPTLPNVVVRSGLLVDQPVPEGGAVPRRLRIDAIGVDAPVVPVGVTGATVQVPTDVEEVGWYRFGGRPGDPGSTVLVAHVSSGEQGPGAFFVLRELMPRDDVIVHLRGGGSVTYRVIARRSYDKADLPDRLFSRIGPEVLIMVTCGGRYSETTGRYEDNVVVFAVPRR